MISDMSSTDINITTPHVEKLEESDAHGFIEASYLKSKV